MKKFKIVPMDKDLVKKIRQKRTDAYGIEVMEEVAKGCGPCRVALRPFRPGEDKRLLFLYSPFEKNNAYNQTGPVFINSMEVEPYRDVYRFPKEIKDDKMNFPLSLLGYNADQQMIFTKLVGDDDVEELISDIFDNHKEVEYLHARNAEAGCFICKIDRI